MDVEEIVRLKQALEVRIMSLLVDFESKTGVTPTELSLYTYSHTPMGSSNEETHLGDVTVGITI